MSGHHCPQCMQDGCPGVAVADLPYEVGYQNGESSATADWTMMIGEFDAEIPDDVEVTPCGIDRYIGQLQRRLAAVEALCDEATDVTKHYALPKFAARVRAAARGEGTA